MMRQTHGRAVVAALLLSLSLAGCRPSPTVTLVSRLPTPAPQPSPSTTPLDPARTPIVPPDLPPPEPAAWTHFLGINEVNGLAFAPDGSLWAATGGGVVRWDLTAGARPPATRFGMADGLPADYAGAVAVAPDGSPWVATPRGAAHYDGTTWTVYTRQDGMADDLAVSVAVQADGVVWVGTTNGASRFDGHTWTGYLPGARVWSLAVAPNGDIWFAADAAGVSRYSPARAVWTAYTPENGLPQAGIKTLGVGPGGDVWAYAGYDQVYRFDGQTWQPAYDAAGRWVCGLAFAGDTPWLATCGGYHAYGQGLAFRRGDAWSHVTAEQGLPSDDVRSVAVGPGGVIAAGTDRGLAVRQDGTWRVLRDGPLLNNVKAVAITPDGAVWLGFGADGWPPPLGGVSRFDGHAWRYDVEQANVQTLAVAPDGTLWAGAGCSVLRLEGQQWQTAGTCDDLKGNVLDLAFERDGAVWAATGLDLARYDGERWTAHHKLVHTIEAAPDGTLWASGWDGTQGSDYVARFDGTNWETVWAGRLGLLQVTPDGQVWGTAGERGLARFDGRSWTFYDTAAGLPLAQVSALAADPAPSGALWIAVAQAVARLDGETWSAYTLPASWTESPIQAMTIGGDATIWLATSQGLLRFRPPAK